jgi:hypothetical protein
MEEIRIVVNQDGTSVVEAYGVKGSGCKELTSVFTHGTEIKSEKVTREFYEQPKLNQQGLNR